jgi:hypothetical protein
MSIICDKAIHCSHSTFGMKLADFTVKLLGLFFA